MVYLKNEFYDLSCFLNADCDAIIFGWTYVLLYIFDF